MAFEYVAVTSDQHITEDGGKLYGIDTNERARHAFQELEQASLPKIVMCLGDLADTILDAERAAAVGSRAAYQNAVDLASNLSKPLLTIPGNHDSPELLREFFPSQWSLEEQGISVLDFNYIKLIGIDARTGPEATAFISQATLERLERELFMCQKAVLFTHFPVAELDNYRVGDELSVTNRAALIPIFQGYRDKILGCFCGHLHLRYSTSLEGVPVHGVPSSSFMFSMEPSSDEKIKLCDDPCGYLMVGMDPDRPLQVLQRYLSS